MYIHVHTCHTCTMIKYSIYVPIDLPNCPKENRPRHITTTTATWTWIPACVHQLFSYMPFRNSEMDRNGKIRSQPKQTSYEHKRTLFRKSNQLQNWDCLLISIDRSRMMLSAAVDCPHQLASSLPLSRPSQEWSNKTWADVQLGIP